MRPCFADRRRASSFRLTGRTAELRHSSPSDRAIDATIIGRVGGNRIRVAVAGRDVLDEPLGDAERFWSDAIGNYFESQRAIA